MVIKVQICIFSKKVEIYTNIFISENKMNKTNIIFSINKKKKLTLH